MWHGQVFKQACEVSAWNPIRNIYVTWADAQQEYGIMPCLECGGAKQVEIHDVPDSMRGVVFEPGEGPTKRVTCTACKGSGQEYINLI